MHTSIIYVTKKVIHWGANHPNAGAKNENISLNKYLVLENNKT